MWCDKEDKRIIRVVHRTPTVSGFYW